MTSKIIDWDAVSAPLPLTLVPINGAWVLRITPDRKIEVNEDVEVSVLAQQVLDAVQVMLKPKEWQSLSDVEIEEVYEKVSAPMGERRIYEVHTLAKALDAKLKEKNNG